MKCDKCKKEFEEKDLQLSHDIPRYIGGTDKDGRHWLCKKCHDIYEKIAFSVLFKDVPLDIKLKCICNLKEFSRRYFV